MSRKHNTKHERARSHYPERLRARGVSNSEVRMPSLDALRSRARRRAAGVTEEVDD